MRRMSGSIRVPKPMAALKRQILLGNRVPEADATAASLPHKMVDRTSFNPVTVKARAIVEVELTKKSEVFNLIAMTRVQQVKHG
jgi:hypothetical protein